MKNAKKVLQNEFNIPMVVEINEEMDRMCNLSESLIDKGREEGLEEGLEKVLEEGMEKGMVKGERKATLNHLSKLMEKMKLDAGQAFEVLGIPEADRSDYLKELQAE